MYEERAITCAIKRILSKVTEVSKYRREEHRNLRLEYILGILSRKFRSNRPERKFNYGLIVFRRKQPVTSQVSE